MAQKVLLIVASPELGAELLGELRQEGLELYSAASPEEGVRAAAELAPDLVLVDSELGLPGGIGVCQRLKDEDATALLPLIFLAPAADVPAKVRAFDIGAVDCVSKPIEPAELRARVRAALRTKRYQDLLSARAQLDALTGLRNRAYFDARIREAAAACRHRGTPYCVVMIDLDHFKAVNDEYGHPFGDRVLQHFAETASGALRASDALCRYGGEEFALVHIGKGQAGGVEMARRIQERLAQAPLVRGRAAVPLTASFGVAGSDLWGDPGEASAEAVIAAADAALYAAKRSGRDRVCEAGRAVAVSRG